MNGIYGLADGKGGCDGTIRPCVVADLDGVLDIERACYPHPWSREQFRAELSAPHANLDLLHLDGHLAGYICYWLVATELHILNVATSPVFRRRKVAYRLLAHALTTARAQRAERACLEVRCGNRGAIALYRAFGFGDDCIRRAYYSDGEDALLMSCPLQGGVNDPGEEE